VILASLICAQGAHAGWRAEGRLLSTGAGPAPRSFYGLMAAEDPGPAQTARMAAMGVGTLRINLVWSWVQPDSPATYDWSHYDEVIGDAAQNGIRVLPTVYGSPSWAALRQNYPPWGQANVEAFRAFAFAAAQRYGADGSFWAAHPEIPRLPVIWWQLWNEASSSSFWDATPKAREYIDLLRVFREGIKRGDPGAKILLTGLFPAPLAPNSMPFRRYLRALYKGGAKSLFDGAALHPYSTTPEWVLRRVRAMRRIMSRYGDRRKPIWITEVCWPTGGLPGSAAVSPEQQALYLTDTYRELAAVRERLGIAGVVWFSLRDSGGWAWFNNCGLLSARLTPKPSASAFRSLTQGGG
jgi:hypothetical protein